MPALRPAATFAIAGIRNPSQKAHTAFVELAAHRFEAVPDGCLVNHPTRLRPTATPGESPSNPIRSFLRLSLDPPSRRVGTCAGVTSPGW